MRPNEDFTQKERLDDLARWFVTTFVQEVARSLPPATRLLDAGAGESVYKRFFEHCDYKAADLAIGEEAWNYAHLDYVAPLHDLPVGDGTFDAVLCTQVLEHLEYPRESVREFHRVLTPGGKLFITVPMAQAEHQVPYDFFRYTSYGLRSILAEAGFDVVEVRPFGGTFTRWAYELPRAIAVLPPTGLANRPTLRGLSLFALRGVLNALIRPAQHLLLSLEKLDHQKNDPFGWGVVAEKGALPHG